MITTTPNYIPECTATLKPIALTLSLSGFLGEEKERPETTVVDRTQVMKLTVGLGVILGTTGV